MASRLSMAAGNGAKAAGPAAQRGKSMSTPRRPIRPPPSALNGIIEAMEASGGRRGGAERPQAVRDSPGKPLRPHHLRNRGGGIGRLALVDVKLGFGLLSRRQGGEAQEAHSGQLRPHFGLAVAWRGCRGRQTRGERSVTFERGHARHHTRWAGAWRPWGSN